jgi:hypothetical protein
LTKDEQLSLVEDDGPKPKVGKNQPWGRRITETERQRLLELEREGKVARLGQWAYVDPE